MTPLAKSIGFATVDVFSGRHTDPVTHYLPLILSIKLLIL
jgi:hypothetical protein